MMQQPPAATMIPQQPPPQLDPPPQQPWMMMPPPPPQFQQPPPPQMWTHQQPPPQAPLPPAIQSQPYAIPNANTNANMSHDEVRSLWIGDLQYWMDENYLFGCFAATGEVVSVKVIRNKQTQLSEGYGFIEFVNRAAAERTLSTYNGTLMPQSEQAFRLNWASLGAGQRRQDDTPDHSIFVGDLAADVTDLVLQEAFRAHYPSVKGAKVIIDHATGRSKGYGFVKFADEAEQQRAMNEMNGAILSTRPMRIGPASNKKPATAPQKECPIEWGSMYTERYFSVPHYPRTYTYRDYIDAWSRVLLLRPANHSWFILIDEYINKQFPIWFIEWWSIYGTTINILPPEIKPAYNQWEKTISNKHPLFAIDILFFATFSIPWIFCWTYHLEQFLPQPMPLSLTRHFKTRFWDKFDLKLCSVENVAHFLKTGTRKYRYWADEADQAEPSSNNDKKTKSRQHKTEESSKQSSTEKEPKKTKSQTSTTKNNIDTGLLKILLQTDPKLAELYLNTINQETEDQEDEASSNAVDKDSQDPYDF